VTDVFEALSRISGERSADPLKPVTVISPTHASALHLRRRLASLGPFAAVRFETMPRLAELLGAGRLAAVGKAPLARPIGDYVAAEAGKQSRDALQRVGELPGYSRTLRQIFRRLRRAGIKRSSDVTAATSGHLPEILRLYDLFREGTRHFYDTEDVQEAAAEAIESGATDLLGDFGEIYVVPPGAETDASARLLEALRHKAQDFKALVDPTDVPDQRFVIAPDPASEARDVARAAIAELEAGVAIDEIAVFHGADGSYSRLLREAFALAGVPSVPLPGVPLTETRTGRGVLLLGRLPDEDFSRTATIEFLSIAPIREWLPSSAGVTHEMASAWDNISREAGITHGTATWTRRLAALAAQKDAEVRGLPVGENEARERAAIFQRDEANRLRDVIATLVARIEPLKETQPAAQFIERFKTLVSDYISRDAPELDEVIEEIDQLGTVGAVGGSFSLASFMTALAANFEARYVRPNRLGGGVVIADYRAAAGLRFERVFLCGAYEGAFPGGPGTDALIDDSIWRQLKSQFPYIDDVSTRIERARAAAGRAVAAGANASVVWSTPAYEPGGTREYYPSPVMAAAYSDTVGRRVTATELRREERASDVLSRASSPLAVNLRGALIDESELAVRQAVDIRRSNRSIERGHERARALEMLRSRRSDRFTAWDGNLSPMTDEEWLPLHQKTSPTSLETYASCGYRYFAKSVLRLNVVEEPDERAMMDAAARGSLIHDVLEEFFAAQQELGRPLPNEAWTTADADILMTVLDKHLSRAELQGLRGLPIYATHEARSIRSDLKAFLDADSEFRRGTGAVPHSFECPIPEQDIAGVTLRGRVDRIDRTPDGEHAWVIDYKTGRFDDSLKNFETDPLVSGTRLQLPTYIAAAEAKHITALYWFITQRGGFERVPYEPTPDLEARFRSTVEAIVGAVKAGAFPAIPGDDDEWHDTYGNCRYCDFDRICSRRRDSEHDNKKADTSMSVWHNVGRSASPETDL
jgi:hypothetical protein